MYPLKRHVQNSGLQKTVRALRPLAKLRGVMAGEFLRFQASKEVSTKGRNQVKPYLRS